MATFAFVTRATQILIIVFQFITYKCPWNNVIYMYFGEIVSKSFSTNCTDTILFII